MNKEFIEAISSIDERKSIMIYHRMIRDGVDPNLITNDMNIALQQVARLYEEGEYYIADLIIAGDLITTLMQQMHRDCEMLPFTTGDEKIVVGTVYDDIHEVGKNIFISMLRSEGLNVVDIGADVPTKRFIQAIRRNKPAILGISGILTSVIDNIKEVIHAIEVEGLRDNLKIILGGNIADENYCRYVKADGYSKDAIEGVKICINWLKESR